MPFLSWYAYNVVMRVSNHVNNLLAEEQLEQHIWSHILL